MIRGRGIGGGLSKLEIEAQAKRRLADEYDAAEERGEVAFGHDGPGAGVIDGNAKAVVWDLGLTCKQVQEARQLRDAELVDSRVIRDIECAHCHRKSCLRLPRHCDGFESHMLLPLGIHSRVQALHLRCLHGARFSPVLP